jgi:hypothetical protein
MTSYIIFHHILPLVAIYYGIKNLSLGFNRAQSWTFSVRKHTQIGFTFVILTAVGLIISYITDLVLRNHAHPIIITGYKFTSILILIFIILITVSGIIKKRHTSRLQWLQFLHPWIGLLAIGLMFAQILLILTKLIGW